MGTVVLSFALALLGCGPAAVEEPVAVAVEPIGTPDPEPVDLTPPPAPDASWKKELERKPTGLAPTPNNGFVGKFSSKSGARLSWYERDGNVRWSSAEVPDDRPAHRIAVDDAGAVYSADGSAVQRLHPTGDLDWKVAYPSTEPAHPFGLLVVGDGEPLLGVGGAVNLDPTVEAFAPNSARLVRHDREGLLKAETSEINGRIGALRLAEFANGDVLLAGAFDDLALDVGSHKLVNSGLLREIFVARIGPDQVVWAQRIGGAGVDVPRVLSVDDNGNVNLLSYHPNWRDVFIGNLALSLSGGVVTTLEGQTGNPLWVSEARHAQNMAVVGDVVHTFHRSGRDRWFERREVLTGEVVARRDLPIADVRSALWSNDGQIWLIGAGRKGSGAWLQRWLGDDTELPSRRYRPKPRELDPEELVLDPRSLPSAHPLFSESVHPWFAAVVRANAQYRPAEVARIRAVDLAGTADADLSRLMLVSTDRLVREVFLDTRSFEGHESCKAAMKALPPFEGPDDIAAAIEKMESMISPYGAHPEHPELPILKAWARGPEKHGRAIGIALVPLAGGGPTRPSETDVGPVVEFLEAMKAL